MVELRLEDPTAFNNFMRTPPEMYDEILTRIEHQLTKQHTSYREPLDPALELVVSLRHLASGAKYTELQYVWRIPPNTISIVVREVCQAICDEYIDEVMTPPTTPEEWQAIAEGFLKRWNFPYTIGALDGKHVAIRCQDPCIIITRTHTWDWASLPLKLCIWLEDPAVPEASLHYPPLCQQLSFHV